MFFLKACPRCEGDLYTGMDDELTCIQCGKDVGGDLRERLKSQSKSQAARRRPALANQRER